MDIRCKVVVFFALFVTVTAVIYIVTMEGGGDNGFEATAVGSDEKIDTTSELVTSYAPHLERKHDMLFEEGSYKKLYSYKHLINGFAAHLSPVQAAMLRGAPGVKSVVSGITSVAAAIYKNHLTLGNRKMLPGIRLSPAVVVAPVARGQQVPCYFVFGDSQFDNGNNNVLNTTAKVNYLPYGIDFPQGPTGRFSNGRIIPDVIATLVGFNDPIPPLAGALPGQANIGLNYASGGGGIREESSTNLGERISLGEQIDNHRSAIRNAAVPQSKLKQCLYTINIGSNDYLNNYFLSGSRTRSRYTPDQYARSLIRLYRLYLTKLYLLGARNVALFGIGKIGCTPRIIATLGRGVGCAEEVNQAADLFNTNLKALVTELNNNLGFFGVKFTYVDVFSGNAADFAALGITVAASSCCTVAVADGEELCSANGPICPDRTKYIFWDNVHTTEVINVVVANSAFNGVNTSPFSISQLVN